MAPRSEEPRRDASVSRRGSSRTGGGREPDERGAGHGGRSGSGSGLGGISDARAYTPRGRTVRDNPEPTRPVPAGGDAAGRSRRTPRSSRSADPFRPALQVLDGGRTGASRTTRRVAATGTGRTITPRPVRGGDVAKPVRRRPADGAGGPTRAAAPTRRPGRRPRRPPRLADPHRRLRLGTLLALAMFTTIGIRLVALQVVDAPEYDGGGVNDRVRQVVLPAPRGAIYDRSGAPLARSVEARYVYADPQLIEDPARTAATLSPLLGLPASDLAARMKKQKRPDGRPSEFEYLARGVEIGTAEKIMELNLGGIATGRDERREVPGGDLAANLIGFTSQDLDGLEGIEAGYDDLLRGVNGKREYEVGNGELAAEIPGGYSRVVKAQPGSSLELTIDRDLQYTVQRILTDRMLEVDGTIGAAVVLDVRSGEVLAQASYPTYDAADWRKYRATDRDDAATSFVVDPGSVHKALVFGAGLEEGVITPDTAWPVPSVIRKGGEPFPDTHPVGGRKLSVAGMLGYSSNVGTIKIAEKLGAQKLYEYQLKFGLGQPTGEGVLGEASGRVLKPSEYSESTYGSVPIGHSVDVTPLQMAAAYAAIANDGKWVQPHLVREIIGPDGKRKPATTPETRQVISPTNAAALRRLMEAPVTIEGGTGTQAAIPGYRVAGKTGTGLRVVNGEYVGGEVASFIGMDQADQPRYVIAVFGYTPGGGGGDISAPAFKEMMNYVLRHYRVPSTGSAPPKFVVYPR
ncbi:peptidoglycan D,D-transpeptidase FtsI family protein [Plantactinospora soyae]|uniref:Cell division protein FtsI (Penicillin-binding protein 3) n=1 Tax=Plantactinospora soyae TaxID=1544732 RepID=A0A927R160_9ACTN|nr:penicillin-binding protein 2 [Plantactinospora soyae]MBE1492360.1 cell division protein FtsI (penicillin-binding protein 3) [Plantactinospora soyae]